MRVSALLGNRLRLDGGAMFGNVPRAVWSRWFEPDDQGRIDIDCRSLLVEEAGGRRVLFDAGVGAFFEPKLRERYGVIDAQHVLLDSLGALGLEDSDIDLVVLSHLHFDHAGGLLSAWHESEPLRLLFPRATYVVSEGAWQRACRPHARDKASFITELGPLLESSGRLRRVAGAAGANESLGARYRSILSDGHTPALLVTEVVGQRERVVVASDLVPGAAWVHLPVTMGYDRYPERLVDEKAALLAEVVSSRAWLCFVHDPRVELARVTLDARGRYVVAEQRTEVTRWELD